MIDLSRYIIHDLTHTFDDKIAGFDSESARTLDKDGWNARTLTIYSHAGTHMDAPFHFGVSDFTIDRYTPADVMGKAWIIDVQVDVARFLIELDEVADQLSTFHEGESLIIRTGWEKKYDQPNYKNDLPRISDSLAHWCVEHRVKMLGVEPHSVADTQDLEEVTRIHRILLGGNVIIIEGLRNLEQITSKEVFLMALPLKIAHGDGAPARVIAFEDPK